MKHAYKVGCECKRCLREAARRAAQSYAGGSREALARARALLRRPARGKGSRRPVPGSAEWAETRGDDLGDSPDY